MNPGWISIQNHWYSLIFIDVIQSWIRDGFPTKIVKSGWIFIQILNPGWIFIQNRKSGMGFHPKSWIRDGSASKIINPGWIPIQNHGSGMDSHPKSWIRDGLSLYTSPVCRRLSLPALKSAPSKTLRISTFSKRQEKSTHPGFRMSQHVLKRWYAQRFDHYC